MRSREHSGFRATWASSRSSAAAGTSLLLASGAFFLASLADPGVLLAQKTPRDSGIIRGTIYDSTGVPFADAEVRARPTGDGPSNARTYTAAISAKGVYTLAGLPAGTYRVTAAVHGLQMFARAGVVVEAAKISRLDVHLVDPHQLDTLGDNQTNQTAWDHKPVPSGRAPKTLDGKPDFSGVWAPTVLVESEKAVVLPAARAAIQTMLNGQLQNTPTARCLPWGAGLDSQSPVKFIQSPSVMIILTEDTFPYRQIFLDGRKRPQDADPTWMGYSIGHWEGDSLVVDTTGFNDKAWSPPVGYPHTTKLHMIERFRRIDLGHLEIETTIDDPGTYQEPWRLKRSSHLLLGDEIGEYVCAENNQDVPHLLGK
jgi:Carboxypeptidase regulatory-like domain